MVTKSIQYNRQLRCVDCKHASGRLQAWLGISPLGLKCKMPKSWVPGDWDPVLGKMANGYWQACSTMRIKDECGPDATGWEPKRKRDILLLLHKNFDKK